MVWYSRISSHMLKGNGSAAQTPRTNTVDILLSKLQKAKFIAMVSKTPSPSLPSVKPARSKGCVLVCQQNRTCLKQGAAAVLAAFQAEPIANYGVTGTGCMGQCGSGPMVRIVPDEIWYSQIQPEEVSLIIQHHLLGGKPVKGMLYPKFHS